MDLKELQKNPQALMIGGAALPPMMLFTCCLNYLRPRRTETAAGL